MSEKVTLENLKNYAKEFCAITLTKAYSGKETLSGHELLKLTPVRKINQHIVARLSSHWTNQLQSFNSPYFNFNSDEVKAALEHFSNVVSQHISLRREHLQPWLLDIVDKTVTPLAHSSTLSEAEEELVRQLSTVHPLLLKLPVTEVPVAAPAAPKSVSFFQLTGDEEEQMPTELKEEQKTGQKFEVRQEERPQVESTPQTPVTRFPDTTPESLNSRFKVAVPEFSSDLTYGSVRLKLENIGQSISLAQRFMFVGQLFNGDFEAFSQSIKMLDSAENWEAADAYIRENLVKKYNWNVKNDAVIELVTLARRRFS